MKYKSRLCTECREEKNHGATCILKGCQGFRWICFDCQRKIEDEQKAVTAGKEKADA